MKGKEGGGGKRKTGLLGGEGTREEHGEGSGELGGEVQWPELALTMSFMVLPCALCGIC